MSYNLTYITSNSTGILSFAQNVNDILMFGWLGNLLLIGIAMVLLTSFFYTTNDIRKSIISTGFISFVLALLLRAMNLVPDLTVFISLIVVGLAVAFSYVND